MLRGLPDYTCSETIARSVRTGPGDAFRPLDTLRLQVGWIGGRERYSRPDDARFDDRELRALIGRGLTSNGNFAGHVQHVFLSAATRFIPRGAVAFRERPALRYDYEVPVEYSRYTIRGSPSAEVGIHGSFWFDSQSLDLLRMEVNADEIPPEVGLARLSEIVEYERRPIGDGEVVLPATSDLTVLTGTGDEFRNQTTFHDCRQFRAESEVRFDLAYGGGDAAPAPPAAAPTGGRLKFLPPSVRIDLVLDSEIEPARSAVDDDIRALVASPVQIGERVLIPEGAVVRGRVVRLEHSTLPFDHYVVGFAFHTLEAGDRQFAFFATMQTAGPVRGLLREAKRLDPVFARRRPARLDILVREKPQGEGVLHWDARQPQIRRGLRMRWLTMDPKKFANHTP